MDLSTLPISLQSPLSSIISFRKDLIDLQEDESTPCYKTALISLKDMVLSPLHLALRIRVLVLHLLSDLIKCNGISIKKTLEDLFFTIVYDVTLTISATISLVVSPITNVISQFNGSLNRYFLDNSTLIKTFSSRLVIWICEKLNNFFKIV